MTDVTRGIAMVLLANFMFSLVDTSTKWLLAGGLVVVQLAFMRYAVHFAITCAERLARSSGPALPKAMLGWVLLRAFCLVSATVVNFAALGQLPLTVTSAMLYLSPIFVCVFARLLLGEEITARHLTGLAFGFGGALVILWPFGAPVNWYAVAMLYPASAMALYQVLTRKLAGHVTPARMQFHTGLMGTVVLLPFAVSYWSAPQGPLSWGLLLAIGVFAWFGHEVLTRAHAFAGASTLAPFGYSFILYLTVAGILVFGDLPSLRVALGAALIIGGGLYLWRGMSGAGDTARIAR